MFKQKKTLIVFVLLVVAVFVVLWSYTVVSDYLSNILDNITAPGVMWSAEILTWMDENENKVWDAGEAPLGDVEISVVLNFDDHREDIRFKSYWEGRRRFRTDVYTNDYPKTIEISVEPPDGYVLTTRDRVTANFLLDGLILNERPILSFGFTYLPSVPTVTPLPSIPLCTEELEGSTTRDIAIAPDDTLWFATLQNGAFHFDPSKNLWTNYTVENGLTSNTVWSIAVSSDNVAWFGTTAGIMRFDGSSWTSFTTQDGLPYNNVVDIAITSDDVVWFVTRRGEVGHFSPDTNTWTTEVDYNSYNVNIIVSPDDSLWLLRLGNGTVNQAIPIKNSSEAQVSTTYRIESPFHYFDCSVGADAILADNKFWVVYEWSDDWYSPHSTGNLGYVDLETEEWVDVEGVELFGYNLLTALALAPDGSFWLGAVHGMGHFVPTDSDPSEGSWTFYYYSIDEMKHIGTIRKMVFAPDGALWLGGSGVVRCVIP